MKFEVNLDTLHVESGMKEAAQSITGGITHGANSLSDGARTIGYCLGLGLAAVGLGIAAGHVLRKPTVNNFYRMCARFSEMLTHSKRIYL